MQQGPSRPTIKKKKNLTQNKSQTQRAGAYEVTSFLSTDCELSTVHSTPRSPKHHRAIQNVFLTTEFGLQVLRNGFDQTGRHRRFEAEGGHTEGGRRHLYIQEGEPDDVRMGDQGSVTVGDGV